jgi:hemerythrin superfamily protein
MNTISTFLRSGRQDLVAMLEADHREVEQLFNQIQRMQGSQRSKLVAKLAQELTLHMRIEESIVYPRLGRIDKEMSSEAEAEHRLARKALADLQRLAPDTPGFDGALAMVKAGIEHHVQEEEHEAFPKLRSELDDLEMEQLTEEVRAAKERGRAPRRSPSASRARKSAGRSAPSRSRSRGGTKNPTKADLVRRAKRAGITGYSSMTKDELARAMR